MKGYILNKGFITQKIGKKTTVFAGEESILYALNETAAFIFNGLKLGWKKEKIVQKLVDKYTILKKQAENDVTEFTKELERKKIIVVINS